MVKLLIGFQRNPQVENKQYHNTWSIFTYKPPTWPSWAMWHIYAQLIQQVEEKGDTSHIDMWYDARCGLTSLVVCIYGKK